ncbi:MAG: type I-F CRISPR-associated protein Csy2 [Chromatiales bacterium]|nr:type I-F CRISPR-associated protein Csy2 [Chromatiales bacterium]
MNEPIRQPAGLLLLPRLRVQNANAISSPLTWGFPSPTAFLGFAHALERRLSAQHGQIFDGVGIICHDFEPLISNPNRRHHKIFIQSRNPIYLKRDVVKFIADGTPAAIVEEGRAHLEVSLVIALRNIFIEDQEGQDFAEDAYRATLGMRLAGGSLLPCARNRRTQPVWLSWPDTAESQRKAFGRIRRQLLPGFALVHRPDLLRDRLAKLREETDPSASVLDALLDLTRLNQVAVETEAGETSVSDGDVKTAPQANDSTKPGQESQRKVQWQIKQRPGWLVPLPIGYAGISPLYAPGTVAGARDETTPFRFVESLYSLGQWIGPHRLTSLEQLLWHSSVDSEAGLYRCINRYSDTLPQIDVDALQGA